MSLFTTLSDMSKQHAENSGSYTFEKPAELEPAPTVSLYNLLDHPAAHLEILLVAANNCELLIRPNKLAMADSYSTIVAWVNIIKAAIKEAKDRDSEAWAEKTAKEIVSESKCTGDCYFLPVGGPYSPVTRKKCETCGIIKD